MKAVRYYGPNKPLKVEEIPIPKIKDNEVLVKVKAAGICHTDLHFLDGTLTPWKGELPLILGHEIAGEVHEIGKDVKKVKKGDRVVVNNNIGCGVCEYCKTGHQNICPSLDQIGFTVDGGYAEFVKAPEENLINLPDKVSFEAGSVLPCAGGSAYHALVSTAGLKKGETLMINGFGGLGTMALQIAKNIGAKIIVVDVAEDKLQLAKKMGADGAINGAKANVPEEVKKLTGGKGADVIVEFVGRKQTMENAMNSLAKMGRYVIVGYTKDHLDLIPLLISVGEYKILGSVAYTHDDLAAMVKLAHEGKIEPVVSESFKLEEIPKALELIKEGKIIGRVVGKF